jgi:hypothetical protein
MKSSRRTAVLLVALLAMLLLSIQAMAQDAPATGDTTTTTAATSDSSAVEPAVPVTTPNAAPATADWTYRYMTPTAIVIALLIILFTTVQYFTSVVRKRYRVLDE